MKTKKNDNNSKAVRPGFIFLIAVCCVLASCKKIEELTTFRIKDSTSFTVPGTLSTGIPLIDTIPVESNAQFEFSNNNTKAEYLKEVKLDKLSLTIENPPTQNFNFLKSIHLFISADGLPEREIAYSDAVPANATSLQLQVTDVSLTDYIKTSSYKLRVNAVTDEPIAQDTKIRADMEFLVRAKIL